MQNLIDSKINTLWIEKYRPKNIDELAISDEICKFLNNCIEKKDFPHLLFYGHWGTGKNSIINVLQNSIEFITLDINASEENGIDIIREKVSNFVNSTGFSNKMKVVVFNEADRLSIQAQDALKEIMEKKSMRTRFIFTTNFFSKISNAIKDRCVCYELRPPINAVAKRVIHILKSENINFDKEFVVELLKRKNNSLRFVINSLQKYSSIYDKLTLNILLNDNDNINDLFDDLFMLAKDKKLKEISERIKNTIIDDDLYSSLKRYVIDKNNVEAIIVLSDFAYKSKIVYDQELIFISCILTMVELMC